MDDIVWSPSEDYVERANVTRFMRANGIGSYDELVKRSQEDVEWFWDAVVRDLQLEFYEPYRTVLDRSGGTPWAKWFVGGKVNLAHNCVDRWAERTPDNVAIRHEIKPIALHNGRGKEPKIFPVVDFARREFGHDELPEKFTGLLIEAH